MMLDPVKLKSRLKNKCPSGINALSCNKDALAGWRLVRFCVASDASGETKNCCLACPCDILGLITWFASYFTATLLVALVGMLLTDPIYVPSLLSLASRVAYLHQRLPSGGGLES